MRHKIIRVSQLLVSYFSLTIITINLGQNKNNNNNSGLKVLKNNQEQTEIEEDSTFEQEKPSWVRSTFIWLFPWEESPDCTHLRDGVLMGRENRVGVKS